MLQTIVSWTIREATGADSEAAAAVVRAVYEEYGFTWEEGGYHADLHDLQAHYLDCGDRFWVAEFAPTGQLTDISGAASQPPSPQPPPPPGTNILQGEGGIVATCGLELFPLIPGSIGEVVTHEGKLRAGGSDCSLERLYVHPLARKQGIGAALFEKTLTEARALGRRAMEIWSDKEFGDAHRLYERYGARVIGERICDDPDEAEEWGLVLDLGAEA